MTNLSFKEFKITEQAFITELSRLFQMQMRIFVRLGLDTAKSFEQEFFRIC